MTNKRKNLNLIKIALSFMMLAICLNVGKVRAEDITVLLKPEDEMTWTDKDKGEPIANSKVNYTWYYVTSNSGTETATVTLDVYGPTVGGKDGAKYSDDYKRYGSTRFYGTDTLPAGTTRMYIYTVYTGPSSFEIVEVASIDIVLNSAGEITSSSNGVNLVAIFFGNTASDTDYDLEYQGDKAHTTFTVMGNSKVIKKNEWVLSTGSETIISFADDWGTNKASNFFRNVAGTANGDNGKMSYLYKNGHRAWCYKYYDVDYPTTGAGRLTQISAINGVGNSSAKAYNAGRITITAPRAVDVVSIPSQSGSLTYNGSSQSPSWNNYNTNYMTISGTTSETNAGTYIATFTLKDTTNSKWSDGTTDAKAISWTIGKKTASAITVNPTSLNFTYGDSAKTASISRDGDGTISVSTSASSVATVSLSGTTITVTPKSVGTATITVSVGAGTNYTAPSNVTISVKVSKASATNPTLSSTSVTYDGLSHTIGVTGGSGGTIQYRTSTDGTNFGSWTTTKPTLINVGTVYVQARILGDSNHNDTSATSTVAITISKASGSVVLDKTSGSITYPGTTTFTVKTNTSGGALSVTSSNTNIATASISGTTVTVTAGTTAGEAKITVKSAETANYNSASATYTVTVKNGTLSVTASNYSGTYDGKAHGISVSCSTSGATITYATSQSGTYSTTNPTYTTAGTYTTYYKVTKAGYTTVTGSKTVTIAKATTTVTASITGTTTVGKTLTATPATVSDGSKSYQWWYSSTAGATSGTTISGATSNTYVISSDMSGKYIGVTISVAEGTNYKSCSGTAITTSKVAETNYKDTAGNYYETLKEAFDSASSGSTITVLKNVTDSSSATVASGKTFTLDTAGKTITKTTGRITNNGTLTIQGTGTIETLEYSSNNLHTLIDNNGQLTVKQTTLHNKGISSSYWYTIQNTSGTTNIQSGTIKASGTDSTYNARVMYISSGTINISGGTIESSSIGIHSYSNTTGTINITGGTFTTNNNAVLNITGSNNQTNLNITGGTLKSQSNYAITTTTTGTVKIGTDDKTVSQTSPLIQGALYGINASNRFYFYDGIIKGKTEAYNISATGVSDPTIPTGYEIYHGTETIDGSVYKTATNKLANTLTVTGKTLTYTGSAQTLVTVSNAQGTVYYSTSTALTSSNYTSGSTTIPTGTSAGDYTVYYYTPGNANYNVKSGNVKATISKVTATVSVKITGETVVGKVLTATATTASDGTKSYQWWYSSTANATSGTAISGATSSTYVVTSSVVGYYIGVTVSVAEGTNYKACSGTAITTSKVAGTNYKDNAGNYYETLKEAFDNANSGSTITVLKDVTDNNKATIINGKSFILDLNGKTITVNGITSGAFITSVGTLEVKDNTGSGGTIDLSTTVATGSVYLVYCESTTAVTKVISGTYKVTSNAYYPSAICGNGTINIKGGNIIVTNTGTSGWSAGIHTANGTVNMTGGTIDVTASSSSVSNVQGIVNQGSGASTINISGGTINSSGYGVRLGNDIGTTENDGSVLNISGTAILNTSNYAIHNLYATGGITITGGTIKSTTADGLYSSVGTVTIGTKGVSPSNTSPVIQGTYGINSTNGFEFYGGILKGKTLAHNGADPAIPTGYEVYYDTETIDGTEYKTAYLAPYLMQRETQSTTDDNGEIVYRNDYIIGAERAGKTQYTSDLVSSITLHDTISILSGAPSWDVSWANDGSIMAWLVSDSNGKYELNIGANSVMFGYTGHRLFAEYTNCKSINNLSLLDTSKVIDMHAMFLSLAEISTVDVSSLDTSNVTDMSFMFASCKNLTNLNVNNFDTRNVKNMRQMFYRCELLETLDVSKFNTENVTNLKYAFGYCSKLKNLNLDNFNTENVTDMFGMFSGCESLTDLGISKFDTAKVTDMGFMFNECSSLTNLKLSNFNTENVVNMSYMFRYCSSLTNLNVTGFNTSKVTDMSWMFAFSNNLTNLDTKNFNTANVTNMNGMFYSCTNLKSLLLGNDFDRINGTDMFGNCTSLTSIITTRTTPMTLSTDIGVESLTKLYVPSAEAETAFESATNYAEVFGTERVQPILELIGNSVVKMVTGDTYTELGATVAGMTKNADGTYTPYGYTVTISDLPEITGAGVYKITYTIYEKGDTKPGMSIERIISVAAGDYLMSRESGTATYILGAKRQNEETGEALYLNYTSDKVKTITIINTENTSTPTNTVASWDVSQIYGDNRVTAWILKNDSMLDLVIGSDKPIVATSGTNLFANYSNCTSIAGLEHLNTELVTSMQNMFSGCLNLPSLEVEKMSTNSASTMEGMFKNCNTLTSLNLGNTLTIMCTNMKDMFSGCTNIQSLNVTKFYTVNVKNMSGMFEGCSNLTSLDVKYFDTTNVENFASMFNGCSKLTEIDVKDFMTSKAKSVGAMFKDCSSLETLDLSNFNLNALDGETYSSTIDNVKNINQNFMFDGCTKLEALVLGKKFARINGSNMFRNCNALECIIAQSETPVALGTNTGISNAKIYVPKQANVASYKVATNYTSVFGNEGVRALLEINGENKVQVPLGSSYTDKGATVAGYSESEKAKYERFGYTLTTTGLPIDTNTIGKYHVIYKLYYFDQTIDTASN